MAAMNLQNPPRCIAVSGLLLMLTLGCSGWETSSPAHPPSTDWLKQTPPYPAPASRTLSIVCDSPEFIETVNAFIVAHHQAGTAREGYEAFMADAGVPRLDRILVAAEHLDHNEMHDCQRLLLPNPPGSARRHRLGPIAGLHVSPVVESPSSVGHVVADIRTDSAYGPLHLEKGLNCLWMRREGRDWRSEIRKPQVDPVSGELSCVHPDVGPGPRLQTAEQRIRRLALPKRYPTTGRWMWDDRTGTQYIGIRCGDAWCSIANSSVNLSTAPFARSRDVPGWFDEQYLSYADPETGELVVSDLYGTILPGPGVQFRDGAQQLARLTNNPHVAAYVSLRGEDDLAREAYVRKHGFRDAPAGNPPVSRHRILMRVWKWTDQQGEERIEWQTAMARVGQDPDWQGVKRLSPRPHSGLGTVRWAWSETDEDAWVSCDNGCCYGNLR